MINYKFISILSILFYLQISLFQEVFAQDLIVLSNQKEFYSLSSEVYFLEDKSKILDVEDVLQAEFSPPPKGKLSFGYSFSTYWLKFDLKNTDTLNNDWILEFTYPILDSITIYAQNPNRTWQVSQLGDHFKFEQRHLNYKNPTYVA